MATNRNVLMRPGEMPPRAWPLAVGVIAFVFFLALWPRISERLDPLTGDEPFYVMTAISLLRDQDLDESNNYTAVTIKGNSGPHTLYAFDESLNPPDPLPPGWRGWPSPPRLVGPHTATTERDGLFTKHGIGLSALIALPWALAGRFGANLAVMLAAAILASQMYLLARENRADPSIAAAVALGLTVSIPIGPYALLLFPEVPAALLLIYAIRRAAAPENAWWQLGLSGCAIGLLPWLHQRFVPTAAVLALVVFLKVLRSRDVLRNAAFGLGPIAVGGICLLAYNQWLYGLPVQRSEDHAGFNRLVGTINGGFGLLLDAQWGILITAPVFILAIAAFPIWRRDHQWIANIVLVAVGPYLVIVAAYKVWWGEWGPPARYLVPIVPLAAGPLAAWLQQASVRGRLATYALWSVGMLLTVVGYQDPQRFYHHPDGVNNLIVQLGDQFRVDLQQFLVAFQPYSISPLPARFWISTIFVACLIIAMRAISGIDFRGSIRRAFKSLVKNLEANRRFVR
ncbi:hypothetical protein BH23CHL2_BH23CHL2_19140 [soil metagenome]